MAKGRRGPLAADFTVAFDWNGTLVDDAERARLAVSSVLRRRGLAELGSGAFHDGFCLPMTRWLGALGINSDDVEDAVREWNDEVLSRHAALSPDALTTVARLKSMGIEVGVVSAAATATVRRDLQQLGLAEHVGFVVGAADPKGETLRGLMQDLPGDLVYVGDTEYDMSEARSAGAWAIGYGGGYRPAAALAAAQAVHVIDRLSELPGLLTWLRGRPAAAGNDGAR